MEFLHINTKSWSYIDQNSLTRVPEAAAIKLANDAMLAYAHFAAMRSNIHLVEAAYKEAKSRLNECEYERQYKVLVDQDGELAELEAQQMCRWLPYESGRIALRVAIDSTRRSLAQARELMQALISTKICTNWSSWYEIRNNYRVLVGIDKIAGEYLSKMEQMLANDPTQGKSALALENAKQRALNLLKGHQIAQQLGRVDSMIYIAEADGQPVTPSLDTLIKSGQKYLAIDALTEVNRWHSAMSGGSKREDRNGLNPPVYNGDSKLFNIHWQYLNAEREASALVSMLAGLKTAICFAVSELLAEQPDQLSIDAKVVNNCLAALSVARKCMNRIVEINLLQNKLDLNIVGHANLQNIGKELETGGLPDVSSKWYPLWNLSQDKLRQELEQARIQGILCIRT